MFRRKRHQQFTVCIRRRRLAAERTEDMTITLFADDFQDAAELALDAHRERPSSWWSAGVVWVRKDPINRAPTYELGGL